MPMQEKMRMTYCRFRNVGRTNSIALNRGHFTLSLAWSYAEPDGSSTQYSVDSLTKLGHDERRISSRKYTDIASTDLTIRRRRSNWRNWRCMNRSRANERWNGRAIKAQWSSRQSGRRRIYSTNPRSRRNRNRQDGIRLTRCDEKQRIASTTNSNRAGTTLWSHFYKKQCKKSTLRA